MSQPINPTNQSSNNISHASSTNAPLAKNIGSVINDTPQKERSNVVRYPIISKKHKDRATQ